MNVLQLPHGQLQLPVFLPDATMGVVRSVDSADLVRCGVQGVVMNAFHLMQHPGSSTVQALGGLHAMSGWQRPIVTDSGGFQAYSLIRQNPKLGSLTNNGLTFRPGQSHRKFTLTPEKSIQLQVSYGADVVVCLDDCTHVDASLEIQRESVERTIDWARLCKGEFERLVEQKDLSQKLRPLLLAVVQGGGSRELRKRCAEELLEIGFDGFGYGGWPLDGDGNLLADILAYVRELVPAEFPTHALGVGHPAYVVACVRMGYDLFDCSMPTRDARRGRLYALTTDTLPPHRGGIEGGEADWFSYVYATDDKHIKSDVPISPYCDCPCCANTSLGYLHHLFAVKDGLALRLATMHNLRFMTQLMARLREE
ncbi:MAG: queuine tRNA-ribosyltransferase family protein [Anaerolineae bacterium]|nr:queuine tRNA-ribosyltransferase family protein [Anaerolineae bacterium]